MEKNILHSADHTPSADQNLLNSELYKILSQVTAEGARNAASGLTQMTGQSISMSSPDVAMVSLLDLPKMLGSQSSSCCLPVPTGDDEAIGIYLRVEGGMNGQIMLIMPYQCALQLVDLLLDNPPGTSQELGRIERSALGEVGNLIGSFFLNTFSVLTGCDSRPTPPAVMVDMLGAIIDIVIATAVLTGAAAVSEEVILLRSTFANGSRSLETSFWVIPDPSALERLRHTSSPVGQPPPSPTLFPPSPARGTGAGGEGLPPLASSGGEGIA